MRPYFPVALNLVGERAVIVGGDHEAVDKARKLVRAQAEVRVVWPEVEPELRTMAENGAVRWIARDVRPDDLRGARVVVLTVQDADRARDLRARGRREGFWLCAIDQPEHCDWVNVGQIEAGPIRLSIASGGGAPALIKRLREDLSVAFDERFAAFAQRLVRYREGQAARPSAERRRRLALALEGFRLEIQICYPPWESSPDGEPPE